VACSDCHLSEAAGRRLVGARIGVAPADHVSAGGDGAGVAVLQADLREHAGGRVEQRIVLRSPAAHSSGLRQAAGRAITGRELLERPARALGDPLAALPQQRTLFALVIAHAKPLPAAIFTKFPAAGTFFSPDGPYPQQRA